jgi:thymidylate kinase
MRDKSSLQPKPRLQVPKPTLEELWASAREFNRTGTDFLKVDVATGLMLAKAALSSHNAEKKQRNQKSARKAYDTIVRMVKKITPTDTDARQLNDGLHQLKADLIELGEIF